jgi:uncharacterized protein (TIGR02186 family)
MVAASVSAPAAGQADGVVLTAEPERVDIGLFFGGEQVRLAATVPSDSEVAVVISGDADPLELTVKGKVWGLLWLNVREVVFTSLPSLYLAATSAPLEALAEPRVLEDLGVGYGAVEAATGIEPDSADKDRLFAELVALKEAEGLYGVREGGVRLEPDGPGTRVMSMDFAVSPRVPPGHYRIRLLGFAGGQGRQLAVSELTVDTVGVVRFISDLARTKGLLYGVLAVIIAVAAGLVTGVLFGLGKGHGH